MPAAAANPACSPFVALEASVVAVAGVFVSVAVAAAGVGSEVAAAGVASTVSVALGSFATAVSLVVEVAAARSRDLLALLGLERERVLLVAPAAAVGLPMIRQLDVPSLRWPNGPYVSNWLL